MTIVFTEEQERALSEMEAFLSSPEAGQMCLQGFAGTGKTTVVQEMVRRYNNRIQPRRSRSFGVSDGGIVLTAPTNKATNVLRTKNRAAGLETDCTTIHKLLGVKPSSYSEKRSLKKSGRDGSGDYSVVVIDECSMVSSELMALVQKQLRFHKIIYVGDPMQLPPVGEEMSDTFRVKRKAILYTVMRQRDQNPIVALTADLRAQIEAGEPDYGVFHEAQGSDGTGIFTAAGDLNTWMLDGFLSKEFAEDNDKFRYLAWTNETVRRVNQVVRNAIYGRDVDEFVVGERLLFKKPAIKYRLATGMDGDNRPKADVLFNTDEESVVKACDTMTFSPSKMFYEIFGIPWDQVSWMPDIETWNLTMEAEDGFNVDVMALHSVGTRDYWMIENRLKNQARANRAEWPLYYAFTESFAETQPVYALTVHRSQGSTFETVFVDLIDIRKNRTTVEMLKLLYVAASRPSKWLVV